MKYFGITFLGILFISCVHPIKVVKSISCSSNFELQFDKTTSKGQMRKKNQKNITLIFLNYFSDSIKVYFNGKLKFQEFVVTDSISGDSHKRFFYDLRNEKKLPILKVESSNRNCFDIQLNKKYKLAYLFLDDKKNWTIRFSNKYYVDN